MGPSTVHTIIAFGISFVLAAILGAFHVQNGHWIASSLAIGYFIGRELAQSFRPTDLKFNITMANIRQAGYPTIIMLTISTLFEIYW